MAKQPVTDKERHDAAEFVRTFVLAYVLSCGGKHTFAKPFPDAMLSATDGGEMPVAQCPPGADPNCCRECYDEWSPLWDLCDGDAACEAQVFAGYLYCLDQCPVH